MFAAPIWLVLAVVLPLLVLVLWAWVSTRTRRTVAAWSAPGLRHRLVRIPSASPFRAPLAALGLALIAIAFARPQWGVTEIEIESEGRNLIVAIDTSRSMLAEDIGPNRITRAKLAAQDLVAALPSDRVGVLAFAGQPFLQAPLTIDHGAVSETLFQIDTGIIPRGGTNLALAIRQAIETFQEAGDGGSALVIFSDGDEHEGEALKAAEEAAAEAITIVTVGVGTEQGAPVPEDVTEGAQYVTAADGSPVISRLEKDVLQGIANVSGGRYLNLSSSRNQEALIEAALADIERAHLGNDSRIVPNEHYRWPLALGLLLLAAAHLLGLFSPPRPARSFAATKTGATAATTALALLAISGVYSPAGAQQATVNVGSDADKAPDIGSILEPFDKAIARPWRAHQRPRLSLGKGLLAYDAGDFETAAESFGNALLSDSAEVREDGHYNLGNSLYQSGLSAIPTPTPTGDPGELDEGGIETIRTAWSDAISHYESTLELNPENADAKQNRDFVKARLDELEKQIEEEQEQEQEEPNSEEEEPEGDGEEPEEEESESGEPDEPQDEGGEEGEEEQPSEENGEESEEGSEGENGEESEDEGEGEQGDESEGEQEDSEQGSEGESEGEENENGAAEGESEGAADGGEDQNAQAMSAEETENPETGFSTSRARAILRAFADEDLTVRPDAPQAPRRKNYKDW